MSKLDDPSDFCLSCRDAQGRVRIREKEDEVMRDARCAIEFHRRLRRREAISKRFSVRFALDDACAISVFREERSRIARLIVAIVTRVLTGITPFR
jgi:hypothetical protein